MTPAITCLVLKERGPHQRRLPVSCQPGTSKVRENLLLHVSWHDPHLALCCPRRLVASSPTVSNRREVGSAKALVVHCVAGATPSPLLGSPARGSRASRADRALQPSKPWRAVRLRSGMVASSTRFRRRRDSGRQRSSRSLRAQRTPLPQGGRPTFRRSAACVSPSPGCQ